MSVSNVPHIRRVYLIYASFVSLSSSSTYIPHPMAKHPHQHPLWRVGTLENTEWHYVVLRTHIQIFDKVEYTSGQ